MKIVFICGSLEPGCDGVGDYTRRLAVELARQGYDIRAIALHDSFVVEVYNGVQNTDGNSLHILRIPSLFSSKERYSLVQSFIESFDPIWVSLQFVPFAYHPKGLPFLFSHYLAPIIKGRLLHLMVHELWVGMEKNLSLKYRIWGAVQKQLIRTIFSKLKPTLTHSQIQLYVEQMNKLNFKTNSLPLFSNIPVHNVSKLNIHKSVSKEKISFVVFGSVHSGAPINEFASEALSYSQKKSVELELIMIGRSGDEQTHWTEKWKATGLAFHSYGEQPPSEISKILSNATIGISTNPIALVGKSGTVAAMCEHDLPVLCVSHPWIPRHKTVLKLLPGISEYHPGSLESYLDSKLTVPLSYNVCDIASKLANSFQSWNNHLLHP